MSEHAAIMETLEEYARAYCEKDVERLMTIFVNGQNISLIGTGADELCSGRDAIAEIFERNFREATATRFEWLWQDLAVHGDAATVAITLNIHLTIDGEALVVPIRWTVALVKQSEDWKWVHRHASSAAGSQDEGTAYPTGD